MTRTPLEPRRSLDHVRCDETGDAFGSAGPYLPDSLSQATHTIDELLAHCGSIVTRSGLGGTEARAMTSSTDPTSGGSVISLLSGGGTITSGVQTSMGGEVHTTEGMVRARRPVGAPSQMLVGANPIGDWKLRLPGDARTRSWFRGELIEDIVVGDDVAGNDPAVAMASAGGAPPTQLQGGRT